MQCTYNFRVKIKNIYGSGTTDFVVEVRGEGVKDAKKEVEWLVDRGHLEDAKITYIRGSRKDT